MPATVAELLALLAQVQCTDGRIVAFVGAGGKTSAALALADALSASGARALFTSTTKLRDPERAAPEERSIAGRLYIEPDPASPEGIATIERAKRDGYPLTLAADRLAESGKLQGYPPRAVEALAHGFDWTIVEADGARGLPIKAPRPGEPLVPDSCGAVVAVIGLDCLGRALDGSLCLDVDSFSKASGCRRGERIGPRHIAALAASTHGCFSGCPSGARKILLLNKLDAMRDDDARASASETADRCGAALGEKAAVLLGSVAPRHSDGKGARR